MPRSLSKPLKVVGAVFCVLSPFLTHFLLVDHAGTVGAATAALLLCQGVLIGGTIGARLDRPLRIPAIAAILTGTAVLALFHLRDGLVLSAGAPHAAIYLGLLGIFSLSLAADREPIVTYFARTIHGELSPEIEDYTRKVTWLWCGVFALQLAGSALLLALAPIAWWSIFVNILNLPLIATVMLGERLTRPLWVADPPREYLRDFLRMPQLLRQGLKKPGAQAL